MSREKDKTQIGRLKADLKDARQAYIAKVRASDYRLLKLTLLMLVLLIVAGFLTGRIQL